ANNFGKSLRLVGADPALDFDRQAFRETSKKLIDAGLICVHPRTRRPASVIFIRTTSNARPPASMCSAAAITTLARHRSTIHSTVNPCASMIASVAPLRDASSSSAAAVGLGAVATTAGLGHGASGGGAWSMPLRISGVRGPFEAARACFRPRDRKASRRETGTALRGGDQQASKHGVIGEGEHWPGVTLALGKSPRPVRHCG